MRTPPPRRRANRGGGAGPLVFVLGLLALVAAGVLLARPVVADTLVAMAEDRPGLLRYDVARDLIRQQVGDAARAPADPAGKSITFVVESGDTATLVAHRLADDGVVSRPIVLLLALYDSGRESSLQAGTYRVSPSMAPSALAEIFQRAPGEQLVLRIVEGWRLTEIAAEVQKRFSKIKADDFTQAAVAGTYDYPFLVGLKPGASLEGFLFPDTYFFSPDVTATDIVRTLLDDFQRRAGDAVAAAAKQRDLRPVDIVNIAAIVEREARDRKESPIIASVYWNRVKLGMALDADPTIQYAIGAWRELTLADLKVDSPYNTYLNPGLPPTPICSPGEDALRAAASPADTKYLFFVAKNDGSGDHAFATTNEEQEANRAKYGNK